MYTNKLEDLAQATLTQAEPILPFKAHVSKQSKQRRQNTVKNSLYNGVTESINRLFDFLLLQLETLREDEYLWKMTRKVGT